MSEDGRRIYVGNLDKNCHKDEVEELFVRFGKIESLWLAKQPSGFGFVVCSTITAFFYPFRFLKPPSKLRTLFAK